MHLLQVMKGSFATVSGAAIGLIGGTCAAVVHTAIKIFSHAPNALPSVQVHLNDPQFQLNALLPNATQVIQTLNQLQGNFSISFNMNDLGIELLNPDSIVQVLINTHNIERPFVVYPIIGAAAGTLVAFGWYLSNQYTPNRRGSTEGRANIQESTADLTLDMHI